MLHIYSGIVNTVTFFFFFKSQLKTSSQTPLFKSQEQEDVQAPTRCSSHKMFYFACVNSNAEFMVCVSKYPSILTIKGLKDLPSVL